MLKWLKFAQRLSDIEDALLTFAKRQDELELDYAEVRARCKRLLDRTEKAANRMVSSGTDQTSGTEGAPSEEDRSNSGHLYTAKQRLIQQQILRRRAGL